ncbi:thiamine-phosphate kinase [Alkalihalobacillus oceani]|uniref:thiamine-phosphate kinase n=1 Tax=Halalkalibacter oceani TaxID=1653776 RepID=UPI00203AA96C|nr:thiamine-phosphate kinase [Halalkalibacter oceani]MCM3761069.1 thiamine-phosphate kinase [Halalkalibacter oceani]
MDEFSFINSIMPRQLQQPSLIKGIGDDAAVYKASDKSDQVVCVDTLVEGVHFRRDTLSPFQIGRKGLASNISDLAAMGATPAYYLVSLAVPETWDEKELREIYRGMEELATKYRMDLIGGDTVSTPAALVLTITVIGQVERTKARYRNAARPGDLLFLTGYAGSAAAGLELLLKRGRTATFSEEELALVKAHQEPSPHVEQGCLFADFAGRVALNDISDGVASEADEIAEASHVSIVIEADSLPFHPSVSVYPASQQLDWALYGGEDYVLLGAAAPADVKELKERFAAGKLPFFEVGRVEAGEPGVFLRQNGQLKKLEKKGYNHFQKRR